MRLSGLRWLRGERLYLEAFLGTGERDLIGSRLRATGEGRLGCLLRDEERLCTFLASWRSRDGVLLLGSAFAGGELAGLRFSDDRSLLCSTAGRFGVGDLFLSAGRFGVGDLFLSTERFLGETERLRLSLRLFGVGDRRLGERLLRGSTRLGVTDVRFTIFLGVLERLFCLCLERLL